MSITFTIPRNEFMHPVTDNFVDVSQRDRADVLEFVSQYYSVIETESGQYQFIETENCTQKLSDFAIAKYLEMGGDSDLYQSNSVYRKILQTYVAQPNIIQDIKSEFISTMQSRLAEDE